MNEELRRVRDTLIEELRRSEALTVAGRALFARYAAMSAEPEAGTPPPEAAPEAAPDPPPVTPRRHQDPTDEEDEYGGSFMVRSNNPQPTIPGYRDTQSDLPRSMRDRRR